MLESNNSRRQLYIYLAKFIISFCLLNFGTTAIIGLTVPVGYYNSFIAHYLNYPSLLRSSLLNGTRIFVGFFGMDAYIRDAYHVTKVNGIGVHLVYTCLGYGLMSFWIAFIFANNGSFKKKVLWIITGVVTIWIINVIRISLVLIAVNEKWLIRMSLDNHTVFNIVVYCFIFFMMWLFMRSDRKNSIKTSKY